MLKITILFFFILFSSSTFASNTESESLAQPVQSTVEVEEADSLIDLAQLETESMAEVITIQATGEGASRTEIIIVTVVVVALLLSTVNLNLGYG